MGITAGSFAGIVAADMHFPTRMMAGSFRHSREPRGVPSPFPHHNRHPRHEERQQEEDDGVTEGVAHAVVEELHPRFGPEEFRGNAQRPVGEAEDASYELLQIKTIWKKCPYSAESIKIQHFPPSIRIFFLLLRSVKFIRYVHRKRNGFIDELPWLDTQRSGFVPALENFWNGWASARKDVVLIVCGSATSWIIKKILKNKVTPKTHTTL